LSFLFYTLLGNSCPGSPGFEACGTTYKLRMRTQREHPAVGDGFSCFGDIVNIGVPKTCTCSPIYFEWEVLTQSLFTQHPQNVINMEQHCCSPYCDMTGYTTIKVTV